MHVLFAICFYSNDDLEKRRQNCIVINGVQAIELPKVYIDKNGKEKIPSVYFKDHQKQLPIPFVIYADFESITEKMNTCQPSDKRSYTQKYQRRTACSFGYKVVCHYDKKYSKDVVIYRGRDPVGEFIKCLLRKVKNCQKVIRDNFNKPLKMSKTNEIILKRQLNAIFVRKNINPMMMTHIKNLLEITVMLLVNIVVLRI